jgi:hypothetical protein
MSLKITQRDLKNGHKYVQIKLSLENVSKLISVSSYEDLQPQVYASKIITDTVKSKFCDLVKKDLIPKMIQQNLFNKEKNKKKPAKKTVM